MPSVLVIDDNAALRSLVRTILAHGGFTVREAENGEEGLQCYRAEPADIVLCDIFMPVKEGIETLVDLRREYPTCRVVAMTGGSPMGASDVLTDAQLLGAVRTLTKPFSPAELLQLVRDIIADSSSAGR